MMEDMHDSSFDDFGDFGDFQAATTGEGDMTPTTGSWTFSSGSSASGDPDMDPMAPSKEDLEHISLDDVASISNRPNRT